MTTPQLLDLYIILLNNFSYISTFVTYILRQNIAQFFTFIYCSRNHILV